MSRSFDGGDGVEARFRINFRWTDADGMHMAGGTVYAPLITLAKSILGVYARFFGEARMAESPVPINTGVSGSGAVLANSVRWGRCLRTRKPNHGNRFFVTHRWARRRVSSWRLGTYVTDSIESSMFAYLRVFALPMNAVTFPRVRVL
jgi:hypothetical protein